MSMQAGSVAAQDLSRSQMALRVGNSDEADFEVLRYEGVEGLSMLFRFEIDAATVLPIADAEAVIGQPATFRIATEHGERRFHGVISRCTYTGEGHNRSYYRFELVPVLWLLTHRYDSRIFQDKNTLEIVTEVIERAGVLSPWFELRKELEPHRMGENPYPPREYCVQYRETDFNYISRLLDEEGIYYYFEHDDDCCTLVFSDLPNVHRGINEVPYRRTRMPPRHRDADPTADRLLFRPAAGLHAAEEHVFDFQASCEVRPQTVTVRDYNYFKPDVDLEQTAGDRSTVPLEVSDFPGNYDSKAHGRRRAQIRAEELTCRRNTGFGKATCLRLAPGRCFRLDEHPHAAFNQDHVITRVTHRGRQAITRTFAAPGAARLLSPNLQTSLAKLQRSDDADLRDLATSILSLAHALTPARSLNTRALALWNLHAGQIATDPAAVVGVRGGDPSDWAHTLSRITGHNGTSSHDSEAPLYECEFECIPLFVPFRPPRVTPKPLMRGTQTAVVVGPDDEEIYTDGDEGRNEPGLGRVKVLFHWDREGRDGRLPPHRRSDPTCWIRVNQPWAGSRYGGLAIPRVGQEVIVDFLEGDPDRPIIVGRVYNGGKQQVPQSLPKDKVRTTIRSNTYKGKGFNEITMDDTTGKEHFYVKAQYDNTVEVGNNRNTSVGVDSTELVGQNDAQVVGNNKSTDVTNAYNVTCDTMLINAGTSITLQCGASRIHMNQAGFITITGTVITSAAAINNSVVAPLTQIVGAAMLAEAGGIVQILGGVTQVRAAGQASLYGGKVDVVAGGDNVIQGTTVKIN